MARSDDLVKIAQRLVSAGPVKAQLARRRIRGLMNGKYVIDSLQTFHVWEHDYFPQFYVPLADFTSHASLTTTSAVEGTDGKAFLARLTVGEKFSDRVLIFKTPELPDLVKVDFQAMDQWFEEDVPLQGQHPKDPYKRIDILSSSRPIKVILDGVTLAETSHSLFLLETGLRTRYYLPPTSVNRDLLTKSDTQTFCPYKGSAKYYDVHVNGKEYKDLVWYYEYPTAESGPIVGHLCFYNEKVDIFVDGVKEKK